MSLTYRRGPHFILNVLQKNCREKLKKNRSYIKTLYIFLIIMINILVKISIFLIQPIFLYNLLKYIEQFLIYFGVVLTPFLYQNFRPTKCAYTWLEQLFWYRKHEVSFSWCVCLLLNLSSYFSTWTKFLFFASLQYKREIVSLTKAFSIIDRTYLISMNQ